MKKLAPAVVRETCYIALVCAIFSILLQAVFLILGKWAFSVLWGNLFGYVVAVGNFFLMALTVQKAVEKDEKGAKDTIRLSQNLRFLGLTLFAVAAYLIPIFHIVSFILPYLFPRVAIALRPLFFQNKA